MEVTLVREEELRRVIGLDKEGLEAIAEGFAKLSSGEVVVSSETGVPQAVLLDNGYLTDLRTGLAGAVAAKLLAPSTVTTVGILGSGAQARFQLRALGLVREFTRVLVYSPQREHAERYAAEMSAELGREVTVASAEEVVRNSQLVVSTTPARAPVIFGEWLHPGLHITAVGADAPAKNELEPSVFAGADLVVCDHRPQCFQQGELRSAVAAGVLSPDAPVAELGELVAGTREARSDERQITVCDLTGTGVQDTMIARLALERVRTA